MKRTTELGAIGGIATGIGGFWTGLEIINSNGDLDLSEIITAVGIVMVVIALFNASENRKQEKQRAYLEMSDFG